MTQLNFPGSPSIGREYTENGVTYTWNGTFWDANNASSLYDRFVEVDGDTMTGDLTVPSLNGGPLAGFRNQIANGNMSIWQRGTTGAATAGYQTADRWRINGNRATTINNGPDGVGSCLQALVAGETLSIRQPIELLLRTGSNPAPEPFLLGTTWTLSFLAEDNGGTGGTVDANLSWSTGGTSSGTLAHAAATQQNITSSWEKYSFTFEITNATMQNTYRSLNCNIILNGTGNVRITQVQLEPGPVATPFEHRPIGTELQLCQRYFYEIESSSNGAYVGVGSWSGSFLKVGLNQFTPMTMRAQPTMEINGGDIMVGSTPKPVNTAGMIGTAGFQLGTSDTTGLTVGQSYGIRLQQNQYFSFDAEL